MNGEDEFKRALTHLGAPITTWREDRVARAYWNAALHAFRMECPAIRLDDAKVVVDTIDALAISLTAPADIDGIAEKNKEHRA